jgi:hypothetical protein
VREGDRSRRLVVRLPADLVEKVYEAAEVSHRSVDAFVAAVLFEELARWERDLPPLPPMPEDLQRALDAHPATAAFFATVSRRNHHAILHLVDGAKRPATRARRIQKIIEMLGRGETPYRQ